jgi:hypothetical protein
VLAATRTQPLASPAWVRELALELLEGAADALAIGEEGPALGGERQGVGRAVDQACAAGLLDPGEAARHLAHRHVALARHGRERAERGDAGEQAEVVETERFHGAMVGILALRRLQDAFAGAAVSERGMLP